MNGTWRRVLARTLPGLVAGLLLLGLGLTAACRRPEAPLPVGYLGGMTGRVAGLGVAGRDGVILATEEINRAGGINGRLLEVVARDDRHDPETARQMLGELAAAGVVAVIGPMTSTVAMAVQPDAARLDLVLVSPTVTTTRLSGRQDNFFRVTVPLQVNADKAAEFAVGRGLKRFAVSLDAGNAAYTEDWLAAFQSSLRARGGEVVVVERYTSGENDLFLPLAERMANARADAVLLLAGAMDTALIAQQLRKLGNRLPLFASEWSFTSDVVSFGGRAADELMSFVTYDPDSRSPEHLAFLASFEQRFGYKPSFAAVLAYEATRFLSLGLERRPRHASLREALASVQSFAGLQGEVRIDRYGDPERQTYLAVIRNGRFVTLR